MRAGLVIYGSLDTLSGGYLYDRKLVEFLRCAGDRVEIVSRPWRDYSHHLSDNFSSGLRRQLQNLQVDVLLQDELNHPSLFRINRRMRGRIAFPILSIVHHLRSSEEHPAWLLPLYRRVEREYLRSVDGFIYNSQTTRKAVEDLAGGGHPAVVAQPAGDRLDPRIEDAEIAARARQPGPLKILFLGNLIPRKGLHNLLEALSMLPKEHWRLTAAGSLAMDPAYTRKMHNLVRASGLADRVTFSGPLEEEALIDVLREHQVMAVPSSYEGFGIAYLEGMGSGLPAVATTAGGAAEIITDGQDGFLVPPGDPQALAECLGKLAQDRGRLQRMSLAARARYLAHPTWEQTGARIRQFLVDTLRSKS
jgi:glycosyltransferase involved in cell wall biosynthesis